MSAALSVVSAPKRVYGLLQWLGIFHDDQAEAGRLAIVIMQRGHVSPANYDAWDKWA